MKKSKNLIVRNVGTCITLDPKNGKGVLGNISGAAILIEGDKVTWVGEEKKLPKMRRKYKEVDAEGALVSPGLIDCHTHILFAGSRADEFFRRLSGETYEEIGKKGGGIHRTVASTTEISDGELLALARKRLDRFLKFGVTTVEVKSGYGLSAVAELRLLCLMQEFNHAVEAIPTFLGAHTIPKEFAKNRGEYVRRVCDEMLPQVAHSQLAVACDVFCDKEAFSIEETYEILSQAKSLGLQIKLHADQLSDCGGAELAADLGALSADHLENVSAKGIQALAKKGVVGVLLPGAVFSLGKKNYPPARKLIDAGVKVALSTDCNPGTSHSENLPLMMSLAAIELKMTVEEIWAGVTVNAAKALGLSDRGAIKPGMKADLVVWDAGDPEDLAYHYGATSAKLAICSGRLP